MKIFASDTFKWWYGVNKRPIAHGNVPNKPFKINKDYPEFKYGVVTYEDRLSNDEIDAYELIPLNIVAWNYSYDQFVKKNEKHLKKYFEQNIEDKLRHAVVKHIVNSPYHLKTPMDVVDNFWMNKLKLNYSN